jgi:hypothetical protein
MAEAVSRRLFIVDTRFRVEDSPCEICGELSCTGTGYSPSCSACTCQYHSTVALHTHIIWWMNNRHFGGRISEALPHRHDQQNVCVKYRINLHNNMRT